MPELQTVELAVHGMDCAECTAHVQRAIASLPGVESVEVFLAAEKAVIQLDPALVVQETIREAVERAGYSVPAGDGADGVRRIGSEFARTVMTLFGLVFGAVLFVVVVGEWLGLFEQMTARVPWPVGLAIVLVGGYPVFRNVVRATLRREIISHTMMALGVLAALLVGEWATAAVVVFFMRVGEYAESFTAERARRAVKDLTAMAPQTARIDRDGTELEVPIDEVCVGDVVVVRPGEMIPVDGDVLGGQATVDQATITGESMPVEVGPGARVFAATAIRLGSIRIGTVHVGQDTTFGRVVKMVEEAEAHRADVQRVADRFSAYYLPVVAAVSILTFLIRRDPLSSAAVLVVACSCSFALATPIAMLASIGAGAKRGLLIKGGKYLELLDRADVLLIDKTGTLTLGRPQITDIVGVGGVPEERVLSLAASAERYSEHPLAEAVRRLARDQGLVLGEPGRFESVPGLGVRASIGGEAIAVGSWRLMPPADRPSAAAKLEAQGKTVLFVSRDNTVVGLLAASDTLRAEVPAALEVVRALGLERLELLTGDSGSAAEAIARELGIQYRAGLLPEAKISIVKEYQRAGHVVVMVGDGVNDAPALAQADVGIAMGAAGSDVAVEAGHIALMREDWSLVPKVFGIAHRTMRVVKMNIGFTALYNLIGLSLAAMGLLPPIFAAAAQSLPDLGILANSSRLIRQR